jgi:hypothetical protein
MSNWIPALHAGMTQSRVLLELTEALHPAFSKKVAKDAKTG